MPRNDEEILKLKGLVGDLEQENEELKKENQELKKKLDRARGVPAEVLVARMTGGERTGRYKDSHDVTTKKGSRIEVKLSKVHTLESKSTKRWTWDNVVGPKNYDFLVLAGEKDPRWEYPPDLEYVFFLVPRSKVDDINSAGDCVGLSTNLATVRADKAKVLKDCLVRSQEEFKNL